MEQPPPVFLGSIVTIAIIIIIPILVPFEICWSLDKKLKYFTWIMNPMLSFLFGRNHWPDKVILLCLENQKSHTIGIPTCSEPFKQVNRRRARWRWLMMKMKVADGHTYVSQQSQPHSCLSCPLIFRLITAGLLTHQLLWILLACKCSHQMQNSILNISCHLINFGLQKLKRMYKSVMNINIVSLGKVRQILPQPDEAALA